MTQKLSQTKSRTAGQRKVHNQYFAAREALRDCRIAESGPALSRVRLAKGLPHTGKDECTAFNPKTRDGLPLPNGGKHLEQVAAILDEPIYFSKINLPSCIVASCFTTTTSIFSDLQKRSTGSSNINFCFGGCKDQLRDFTSVQVETSLVNLPFTQSSRNGFKEQQSATQVESSISEVRDNESGLGREKPARCNCVMIVVLERIDL